MASWSSGYAFASGAGGRKFKSWGGQMGHSVANGLLPLQHFFESSKLCCPGAMTRRWAPQIRYMLRRYKASITKDLFDLKIRKRLILKKCFRFQLLFKTFASQFSSASNLSSKCFRFHKKLTASVASTSLI